MMKHRSCGGEVEARPDLGTYDYEHDDGIEKIPMYVCAQCGKEIGADNEVEWGIPKSSSIQAAFAEFHIAHPEVFDYLLALIEDLRGRGYHHYGIGALWERMRWHFQIERGLDEEFKCNNNYRSRYVRLLIHYHPELEDFFETRALKAE